ncbi:hypothetical protein L6452_15228 [Arctium lappa]|uniref:Uncharacterized protein n=1 Tax=Arctium lappa TaxID=4217 RepID=A0ACB9CNA3_ARCLA|nr:hypothetical protein L6452_15228 [Arctium lappa]
MISNLESLRLKIHPQTSDEEFDILSKAEIEESVRVEKLIVECQKDVDLALEVHSSLFNDDKMKKNTLNVQSTLLKEIEEENAKIKEISDASVAWCKKKLDHRSDPLKITAVIITGRKKEGSNNYHRGDIQRRWKCKSNVLIKTGTLRLFRMVRVQRSTEEIKINV